MFKKSQLAMTDLFISIAIFIILIVAIIISWNTYSIRLKDRIIYDDMLYNAYQITDLLVNSQGEPSNWNYSNVQVIGLAHNDHNISTNKLNALYNLSYSKSKELFNIERYEFYLQITNSSNYNLVNPYGNISIPSSEDVTKIRRYVIYENKEAVLQLTIWQ